MSVVRGGERFPGSSARLPHLSSSDLLIKTRTLLVKCSMTCCLPKPVLEQTCNAFSYGVRCWAWRWVGRDLCPKEEELTDSWAEHCLPSPTEGWTRHSEFYKGLLWNRVSPGNKADMMLKGSSEGSPRPTK